jgi:hypothetical protein
MPARSTELWARAHRPLDAAGLAAFRVLFGVLGLVIPVRFLATGGVERFYLRPTFFFPYWGFEEIVRPLPAPWIHLVFVLMAVCGLCVALGLFYRVAIVGFLITFAYADLIDVTGYLNHHYLVALLAVLLSFLPLHRAFSLDAIRRPAIAVTAFPAWMTWLLRFQVAIVYFFAALAKVTDDWMVHAQPLQIWLGARMDTPIVGAFFDRLEVAYLFSWGGLLYDLTIPIWLSIPRTRPYAYAVLLAFHAMTRVLFDIGMFPVIMSIAAVVFFDPSWPRRVAALLRIRPMPAPVVAASAPPRLAGWRWAAVLAIAAWCTFHVAMPLRTHLYGGNVLWHEQGMRWSWRVMCREKNGSVTYRVIARGWERERDVSPRRYLTRDQEQEFAAQPDMILRLAHHIAEDYRARGEEGVEVRVDAFASLNGRRAARLIDPNVDLARVEDGIAPAAWILPEPEGPPRDVASRVLAGLR